MSEWFKELVLKTSDTVRYREFESHTLRQKQGHPFGWSCFWLQEMEIRKILCGAGERRWRRLDGAKPLFLCTAKMHTNLTLSANKKATHLGGFLLHEKGYLRFLGGVGFRLFWGLADLPWGFAAFAGGLGGSL